jgi:hypothetical protein
MKFYEWEKTPVVNYQPLTDWQDYEIPFDGGIKIDQFTQNWIRPDDDVTVEMTMNARVLQVSPKDRTFKLSVWGINVIMQIVGDVNGTYGRS